MTPGTTGAAAHRVSPRMVRLELVGGLARELRSVIDQLEDHPVSQRIELKQPQTFF